MNRVAAVILAAGKGTRMGDKNGSPIPKVMFEINGVPMIRYSVKNVQAAGVDQVVLVVGYKKELVTGFFGSEVEYAIQEQQLGTGHAVAVAKDKIKGMSEAVLVCYGDMPLFNSQTIANLIEVFNSEQPTIVLLSVDFKEPEKWAYGRIIRGMNGDVERIVEQKDCSIEELAIKESNAGFYIFDAAWLWENVEKINNENNQHEYYLTDLIALARTQGKRVMAVKMKDEHEALGINTPEQLALVGSILKTKVLS
ncbi:MAG: Bifunctional protein GlmU [bacterium ADurb.Bin400]|nr:MAG: Bifunctional protein GlmU [bacterium ADurb.Bin400]